MNFKLMLPPAIIAVIISAAIMVISIRAGRKPSTLATAFVIAVAIGLLLWLIVHIQGLS